MITSQVVKERRNIATAEETQVPVPEQNRAPSRSAKRIADTLHDIGLSIIVMSIVANVSDLIVVSRHLTEPSWLSRPSRITPYSLWIGVLFVFAGIVVRDRSWSRRRPGSN
jgi:hypothetical protein